MKKEEEVHKTQNIAENDRLSKEIEIFYWVIAHSLSIRRLLTGQQESKLRYSITNIIGLGKKREKRYRQTD
jgi:hypothetical protein